MNGSQDRQKALILQIIRMSTEDGPGIRTTVFFKGCTLHCSWCHNPESIAPVSQVCWVGSRCIGCRTCIDICPQGALSATDAGIVIDRDTCKGCGTCADNCPGTALELLGTRWSTDELAAEVAKDRAYFDASGGGVTVSGGEPAMQPDFVEEFLKTLKGEGFHTALDTCGYCGGDALARILPHADLVLFDVKLIDAAAHKRFTGHDNQQILDNLAFAADRIAGPGRPDALWIRTPVIPGVTDSRQNITQIGRFIADHLSKATARWELCAFNNLCRDKYRRLDQTWPFEQTELVTAETMQSLAETARVSGADPEIVCWSGATRINRT